LTSMQTYGWPHSFPMAISAGTARQVAPFRQIASLQFMD
jgi:hypothetical protein